MRSMLRSKPFLTFGRSSMCTRKLNPAGAAISAAPWFKGACLREFGRKSNAVGSSGMAADARSKALEMALKQIESQFGKGSIFRLGDKDRVIDVDVISTGSISLDNALGIGGLPKGRIVEIYGPESSGKTTLALHSIAASQKTGGTCAFIDVEHALDPTYARALGVDLDRLYLAQPDTGEQALEIADTLVRSGGLDMLVVDSVAALVPRAEIEGDMGDHHIALQARLMSQALRKLTGSLSKTQCLIVFINQIRHKVGVMFGSPDVTPGGNALKFYSSVRMEIRRTGQIKSGDQIVGNTTRVKVAKNKMSPPFKQAEFDMMYGKGISRTGEALDLAVRFGLLQKAGAWYRHSDGTALAQGREKAKEVLENDPELLEKLVSEIKESIRAGPLGVEVENNDDIPPIVETDDSEETEAEESLADR